MENSQNLCLKSLLPFPLLWGLRNFLLETRVTDELMWRQRPQTPPPKVLTSTFTQVKGNQRQDVRRTSQDPSAAASPTTPKPVLAAHRLFVFTSGAASQVISNRGFKSTRTDSSSEYDIQKNLGGIQTRRLLAESIKPPCTLYCEKKPLSAVWNPLSSSRCLEGPWLAATRVYTAQLQRKPRGRSCQGGAKLTN